MIFVLLRGQLIKLKIKFCPFVGLGRFEFLSLGKVSFFPSLISPFVERNWKFTVEIAVGGVIGRL